MPFVVVSKTGCSHLVVWDGESLARYSFKSNSLRLYDCMYLRVLTICPLQQQVTYVEQQVVLRRETRGVLNLTFPSDPLWSKQWYLVSQLELTE